MKELGKDECIALRSLAILCIVIHNFAHWLPGAARENEFAYSLRNSLHFFYSLLSCDIIIQMFSFWGHLGVPIFVFLSAYGLSVKYEGATQIQRKKFLFTHYKKLFSPLLFGTIAYIFIMFLKDGEISFSIHRLITQCTMTLNLIFPYEQNITPGPYWYFGMTMQLYIIYLFVVYRRPTNRLVILTIASIILLGGLYHQQKVLVWTKYNAIGWLLPFCIGVGAARHAILKSIFPNKRSEWLVFCMMAILLFAFGFNYFLWLFIPAIAVILAISLVKLIPMNFWNKIQIIGKNSLFLFVVHPIIRGISLSWIPCIGNYWSLLLYVIASILVAILVAKRKILFLLLLFLITAIFFIWWRAPLFGQEWSKQTIYVGLLDTWYGTSSDEKAHALWIDDDSSEGVFTVKKIAEETDIQPVFAVIADKMKPEVADSLASWQRQGAGIVLHGLRHERWKKWGESQIENDIRQSYQRLHEQGFDTSRIMKIIIPPHGCNTKAIRRVIHQQGFQMVSGASLVNPDRHVFQFGRIAITPQADTTAMRELLRKAYDRKAFVIFGTHSSIPSCFSVEKTRQVLKMAKEIGFIFDIYE